MTSFTVTAYFNEYLPEGATDVDLVASVTASGTEVAPTTTAGRSELIVLDVSGSMQGAKLATAKRAVDEVVGLLPQGTRFGLVIGNHAAAPCFPPNGGLATVNGSTARDVRRALKQVAASGGTSMSSWLRCAADQLDDDGFAHAVLLTDGLNGDRAGHLEQTLEALAGRFQCDCRGVGPDWNPAQLRTVAAALLGTVGHISDGDVAAIVDELSDTISASLSRAVADVSLQLWTPRDTTIAVIKQVGPRLLDLAPVRRSDGQLDEFPTGTWGDESRDYHLSLRLPHAGDIGDPCMAARIGLLMGDEVVARAPVQVTWTDAAELSATIVPQVAHYLGQEELASLVQQGIEAHREGDDEATSRHLGRAVQIAHELGDHARIDLLARIVDIEDPATGTVVPRRVSNDLWNDVDASSDETVSFRVTDQKKEEEPDEGPEEEEAP